MPNFCSVTGCKRKYYAKGFCKLHYMRNWKHGDPEHLSIIKNGLAKKFPSEHRSWKGAKNRCLKKTCAAYPYYGGRGITICDRWLGPYGFTHFMEDMGAKPSHECFPSRQPIYSLDRVDLNGPYSPSNCRWATAKEQTYNRHIARFITIEGETKTIQDWAEYAGIRYDRISKRHKQGVRGKALLAKPRKWERHK